MRSLGEDKYSKEMYKVIRPLRKYADSISGDNRKYALAILISLSCLDMRVLLTKEDNND